ncbi:hypothetical protein BDZ91DRAFT_711361 [Kalaharituber pfeilii]|nr:hypothetical protein BDZ91DRAFT_711361 [Kalaharituber pfeilii]
MYAVREYTIPMPILELAQAAITLGVSCQALLNRTYTTHITSSPDGAKSQLHFSPGSGLCDRLKDLSPGTALELQNPQLPVEYSTTWFETIP